MSRALLLWQSTCQIPKQGFPESLGQKLMTDQDVISASLLESKSEEMMFGDPNMLVFLLSSPVFPSSSPAAKGWNPAMRQLTMDLRTKTCRGDGHSSMLYAGLSELQIFTEAAMKRPGPGGREKPVKNQLISDDIWQCYAFCDVWWLIQKSTFFASVSFSVFSFSFDVSLFCLFGLFLVQLGCRAYEAQGETPHPVLRYFGPMTQSTSETNQLGCWVLGL